MLLTKATPLFLALLHSTTSILAAPTRTRTQCRCKVIPDTPSPAYTPSTAHWSPSDPSPSSTTTTPIPFDICSTLGPELENFEHTYTSYVRQPTPSSAQKPISTTTLLDAARHGFQRYSAEAGEEEPRPTSLPQQRIICYSEPEAYSDYQGSFVSLWLLQIIVVMGVLACVAEGVYLGLRVISRRNEGQGAEKGGLRLSGGERPLLAIPAAHVCESLFSPGAEKKKRAYESTRYFVKQGAGGKREFIAYDEEDDDEVNRPVM